MSNLTFDLQGGEEKPPSLERRSDPPQRSASAVRAVEEPLESLVERVRAAAAGRAWELTEAAGVPLPPEDGGGIPCPKCGGVDRYHRKPASVAGDGGVSCRRCRFGDSGADWIAAVREWNDWSFPRTIRWAAEVLGLDGREEHVHREARADSAAPSRPVGPFPTIVDDSSSGAVNAAAFAGALGVPWKAVRAMGGGFAPTKHDQTACGPLHWPEWDGDGNVVGVGKRFANGMKGFVAGGRRGLVVPADLQELRRRIERRGALLLPEGFSDGAAVWAIGLPVVGRPAARSRTVPPWVVRLLETLAPALPSPLRLLVVGENDRKADGSWPGREGAEATALALAECLGGDVAVAIVFPPADGAGSSCKDSRDWLRKATAAALIPADDETAWNALGNAFLDSLLSSAERVFPPAAAALPHPPRPLFDPPGEESPEASSAEDEDAEAPFEPFPLDALPEPLRGFVDSWAKSLGQDASWIALPALSALSGAIGGVYRVRLKPKWDAPPLLWTMIVGESGTNKTPPIAAIRAPFDAANERLIADWNAAEAAYEQLHAQRCTEERRSAKAPPDPSAEDALLARPLRTRCLVDDMTTEALAPIFCGSPRGLLLAKDELRGWVGQFGRYSGGGGGADEARWLGLYNLQSFTVERKTGERTIAVRNPAIAVTGGIQPAILLKAFGAEQRSSGLFARFMLTYPPRRTRVWNETPDDGRTDDAYRRLVEVLLSTPFNPAVGPRILRLSEGAKAGFIEWYDTHNAEAAETIGDEAASLAKVEELPARLAIVIHAVRAAAAGEFPADEIDADVMRDAVRIAWWQHRETRRILHLLTSGRLTEAAEDASTPKRWEEALSRLATNGRLKVQDVRRLGPKALRKGEAPREAIEASFGGRGRWEDNRRTVFLFDAPPAVGRHEPSPSRPPILPVAPIRGDFGAPGNAGPKPPIRPIAPVAPDVPAAPTPAVHPAESPAAPAHASQDEPNAASQGETNAGTPAKPQGEAVAEPDWLAACDGAEPALGGPLVPAKVSPMEAVPISASAVRPLRPAPTPRSLFPEMEGG